MLERVRNGHARDERELRQRPAGGGFSSTESRSADPGGASHVRPRRPRPAVWKSATATAPSDIDASSRACVDSQDSTWMRGSPSFMVPGTGQSASTRTADTLYSGVPISGSPTSWRSQFTFASAKWSAIQTRPG